MASRSVDVIGLTDVWLQGSVDVIGLTDVWLQEVLM